MDERQAREEITIALAGDVMLGRLVSDVLRNRGPAYVWGNVLPFLSSADLTIVNLECAVAEEGTGRPWERWHKVFHFKAPPEAVDALKLAGVVCALLANNHVLDYEEEAFLETLDRLDAAGIRRAGAGRDLEEAARPAILDAGGVRIGVLAFTDNEPGWAAATGRPGTNWIEVSLEERSLGPVRRSLARARQAGAELVIFSIHWGPNMVERPTLLFRDFAHAVIDAGVDIFFGHSAHLFQGVEVYKGRSIIYDAGDFVDDYAVDRRLRNDWALLFRLKVDPCGESGPARVGEIELMPLLISRMQVSLAPPEERDRIIERTTARCAEMGTPVLSSGERLWISCGPENGAGVQ